jgi:hypothetical protein
MVTGRSVTAILHFLNQTPMDWYSKKQATVETATFGSEFITARTTIDQIVDLRTTLRSLGVPIREKSYVFGDNKTIIDALLTPHAKLHKRHNALSFHRVREAVASKYVTIFHLPGEHSKIVTKGVMKHTYKAVLYNYCLMQYCCILSYQLVHREGCIPNQREKVSKSMNSSSIGNR